MLGDPMKMDRMKPPKALAALGAIECYCQVPGSPAKIIDKISGTLLASSSAIAGNVRYSQLARLDKRAGWLSFLACRYRYPHLLPDASSAL